MQSHKIIANENSRGDRLDGLRLENNVEKKQKCVDLIFGEFIAKRKEPFEKESAIAGIVTNENKTESETNQSSNRFLFHGGPKSHR
jgi:hypothetical protein